MLCCLALAAIAVLALAGCSVDETPESTGLEGQTQQPQQTQPSGGEESTPGSHLELRVESLEEVEDQVIVKTSYCEVRYPFAFSDVILVTAENQPESARLLFCASVNDAEYPMFSIIFGGTEGIPVGTLTLDDGTVLSVTAQVFAADESLEPDTLHTFYAAQETLNDVISSLMDVKGFVPAQ